MNLERITDDNFILFCASHYDNYQYHSTEEFFEDLNRIKYIKKLITRFIEKDELKHRLILNHIIVLNNCFGPEITCKILYLKTKSQIEYIKPFLVFLNILPDILYNIGEEDVVFTDNIPMNKYVVDKLREEFNVHTRSI